VESKRGRNPRVKYWEIIADRLSKAGWSWGCVSAVDAEGRTIWIVDAHGYGKRFVVRADEKLTAFRELESAVCIHLLTEKLSELKIANQRLTAFLERKSAARKARLEFGLGSQLHPDAANVGRRPAFSIDRLLEFSAGL
jgi:hypothetical protein